MFKSIFSNRANGAKNEIPGLVVPFSHLLTAGIDTLRYSATCSCVSPNSFLLSCITKFIGIIEASLLRMAQKLLLTLLYLCISQKTIEQLLTEKIFF